MRILGARCGRHGIARDGPGGEGRDVGPRGIAARSRWIYPYYCRPPLERMGSEAVPYVVRLLRDKDPHVRELAVQTLRSIGLETKAAIPALTERLRDENPSVRNAAAMALREMGPEAKAAMSSLAELLRDPDQYIRITAAGTLERMGSEAVPSVVRLLRDKDPHVRELAVQTLRSIGLEAKAAIPALTERLRDENPSVRDAAAMALREMGPEAKAAMSRPRGIAARPRSIHPYYGRRHVRKDGFRGSAIRCATASGQGPSRPRTHCAHFGANTVRNGVRRSSKPSLRFAGADGWARTMRATYR